MVLAPQATMLALIAKYEQPAQTVTQVAQAEVAK